MSIKDDVYRYFGKKKVSRFKFPIELRYIITYRKANKYYKKKNMILLALYRYKLKKIELKTGIQIPYKTTIGEGFYIGHHGRLIINSNSIIGKNVNIGTGVTIGRENRGKRIGCPTIGNEVWIGTNSVIVGKIKIGNNVLIAPNSFVNFNVPDNSIVIGNPGKIIKNEKATEKYIENKI